MAQDRLVGLCSILRGGGRLEDVLVGIYEALVASVVLSVLVCCRWGLYELHSGKYASLICGKGGFARSYPADPMRSLYSQGGGFGP